MGSAPITPTSSAESSIARHRNDDRLARRAAKAPRRTTLSDQLPGAVCRAAVYPLDASPRAVPVVLHQLHPAGVVPRPRRGHPLSQAQAATWSADVPAL